nr:ArsC/Spx/MgsR family protein [Sulfobacillus thermosulfidooxidans]
MPKDHIAELAEKVGGVSALLSKTSPSYRNLRHLVHSESEWIQHIAEEPRLIKRPVWVIDDHYFVGFSETVWQEAWNRYGH